MLYRIGMFSKLGKVTIKTLHHYDEMGLLVPASVDEETGYRYYTTDQLLRLNHIIALRQMDFSIQEITDIIDGRNVSAILGRRKAELLAEEKTVQSRLFRLENYILEQEGHLMKYQAVIKEVPAYTIYSAKIRAHNYSELIKLIPALGEKVTKANPGLECVEPGYCYNMYLEGEYKDTDFTVEFCEAVKSRGKDEDGIAFRDIPAATVVSVLHRGPYETMGAAYAYAMQWIEKNGYKVTDYVRESHINGIWDKETADEWLTEIQIPVEKL